MKILFVHSQFIQGGSERFLFEVSRELTRNGNGVGVLTTRDDHRSQFYYEKLRSHGVAFHHVLPMLRPAFVPKYIQPRGLFLRKLRDLIAGSRKKGATREIEEAMGQYDLIVFVQIEDILNTQRIIDVSKPSACHLMSHMFQYDYNPYEQLRSDNHYNFIAMHSSQFAEVRRAMKSDYCIAHSPLMLDVTGWSSRSELELFDAPRRIGAFIRFAKDRPILPILRAFQQLLDDCGGDVELYCYGIGDPSTITRQTASDFPWNRVVFRGHSVDILQSLRDDGIAVAWMTCLDTAIGYASIELGAYGQPTLFANLGYESTGLIAKQTDCALRAFRDPEQLSAATHELLTNREQAVMQGRNLQSYVFREYNIGNHIDRLIEQYSQIRFSGRLDIE